MPARPTLARPTGSGPWPRPGRCSATRPGGLPTTAPWPARGSPRPRSRCGARPVPASRAARRRRCGWPGRRCGRGLSGWKAAPARRRGRTAGMRTPGWPCWPHWRSVPGPGSGPAMVNPGWADLDRGLFPISVAAELAGLHPQTLRIYEREGLLDPARSAGGTRRYSPPGHRPAPGDLRADRRRAEPGRHPPGPAAPGGNPPAASRGGAAERTGRRPPGPCGTKIEAARPPARLITPPPPTAPITVAEVPRPIPGSLRVPVPVDVLKRDVP